MTQTESIAAAIAQILSAAGITVREDTDSLYSFEDKPCIVLDVGNEAPEPVFGQGYVYWDLTVALLIGADGPTPKLAPEPTRAAAHVALYADRTLGGLAIDVVAGRVTRAIDTENPAAGVTQANYHVKYRVLEGTT